MDSIFKNGSKNAIAAFLETARKRSAHTCVIYKEEGRWRRMNWKDFSERVLAAAAGLRLMGIKKGDRVALLATTRMEWTIADCAIMAAGAVSVPIYCSLTIPRIAHILRDSAPSMAIIEDAKVACQLTEARAHFGLEQPMPVVGIRGDAGCMTLNDLIEKGRAASYKETMSMIDGLRSEDPATYVYTSGTTGDLKGVVITHGMIYNEIRAAEQVFDFTPDEIGLLCLPLAHVLGRLMQFYQLMHGATSAYAEGLDKLAENYLEVRPHFVCVVPRMLEKIYERAHQHMKQASPFSRRLEEWALDVGRECSSLLSKYRRVPIKLRALRLAAELLVLRRLRSRLGGRLRSFICGGSRLPEDVAKFLHAAGMLVLEGYGLTETFAAVTVNRPQDYHFGTVGKPLPGISLRLAPDGEILLRGPTVFREYLHLPRDTAEAFDSEGWFKTGDIGSYSRDGFLRITGRKKDMIVTAGGKNIAPQMIESLMATSPYVNHVMVYGDGHKYLVALITLNEHEVRRYLSSNGFHIVDGHSLAEHPEVISLISAQVEERNKDLARFETIKRFSIVEGDFSVESGELTPTLKVRRDFTSSKYRHLLESMYDADASYMGL